jgi:hypothetical protein
MESYNVEIDGRGDTVGELMKRTLCRPYGTDPGLHVLCPSSELLGYCRLSLQDKESMDCEFFTYGRELFGSREHAASGIALT